MKKLLLLLALLAPTTHATEFEPEFTKSEFYTVINTHDSYKEMRKSYYHYKKKWGKKLKAVIRGNDFRAWSYWLTLEDDTTFCVIHMVKPSDGRERERSREIGHEVLHCMHGDFHD